jgi:two-component system, NarL family, sensor histidine kinase UhpB
LRLRTHINLIVGGLSAAFLILVVWVELDSVRRAVREEINASNAVAARLMGQVVDRYAPSGTQALIPFLESLGRVRSNEITLNAANGAVIYESPVSTYKAGRSAPKWFEEFLVPMPPMEEFVLPDGARLKVAANASRAALDGWDDVVRLLVVGVLLLAVLNSLVFWFVSRALAPLPVIAGGLSRLQSGDLKFRLPSMEGYEAGLIGSAFNDMAVAVEAKVAAERSAQEAQARLEERRELSQLIEQHVEEERRMIARELHDEFAQSVTAIRSLAMSIAAQPGGESSQEAAKLIASEAARVYDAMHGLIPRLTPFSLDSLGLADTLQNFIAEWRRRSPGVAVSLAQNIATSLGPSVTLTIYRVVQEALVNAMRHAQAHAVDVKVEADARRALVVVRDDGVGLPEDWLRPGRFGLRGLRERVEQLHGSFTVTNASPRGVEVRAEIPLQAAI